MAIENECNKSGTSSHRSRSSTSFVVSSRFWNVVVVVVVVSKVFSRDVRTHKKRRQKRRLFRGRKEKNAEKKRTHQRRREIRDRARATRRDPSATTPTPEKKRTTFSPRENNNNTTHHKLFRDSFRRHFLRVVFYFCYYKCFRLHTDDVVVVSSNAEKTDVIDDFSAAKPLSSPPNGVCAPRFRAVQTSLPSTMRCALARRVRKSDCVVVKEHEFARFAKVFLFFFSFLCREAFVCVVALKKSKIFSFFFFFFFCFFCDDDETIFLKKYFFFFTCLFVCFFEKREQKKTKNTTWTYME